MIRIFTINESGEVVEETAVPDECLTLATADRIYLRPDWPPIGSPDFAARLRAWHESGAPARLAMSIANGFNVGVIDQIFPYYWELENQP
jgi:hypothetical protein